MSKIQDVGVGKYIRNPRGRLNPKSRGTSVEVLYVASNQGNSFTCFPVVDVKVGESGPQAVLDTTRYLQLPIDSNVQEATI